MRKELIAFLAQYIQEQQLGKRDFSIVYIAAMLRSAAKEWGREQKLDPQTFSVDELNTFALEAMGEAHIVGIERTL